MKKANITVRIAKFERGDIARLINETELMYKDLGFESQGIKYDHTHVGVCIGKIIADENQAIFLAEDGPELIGFVLCVKSPSIFSADSKMVLDSAWWLREEYREGSAIKQLMAAVRNWAKNLGCGWYHAHLTNKKLRIKDMQRKEGKLWEQAQQSAQQPLG